MTDNIEYLILEHLKALRTEQAAVRADLRDIKARLLSIEGYQAAGHMDSTRQSTRLEELEQRLERIETRLGLAEG